MFSCERARGRAAWGLTTFWRSTVTAATSCASAHGVSQQVRSYTRPRQRRARQVSGALLELLRQRPIRTQADGNARSWRRAKQVRAHRRACTESDRSRSTINSTGPHANALVASGGTLEPAPPKDTLSKALGRAPRRALRSSCWRARRPGHGLFARLVPFWAERLGKTSCFARQVSARGGELWCELLRETNRVQLAGETTLYLEGSIEV